MNTQNIFDWTEPMRTKVQGVHSTRPDGDLNE